MSRTVSFDNRIPCIARITPLLLAACCAMPLHAAVTTYSSLAAWQTAVTGYTEQLEDFDSLATGLLGAGTTDLGLFDVTLNGNANAGIFDDAGNHYFVGDLESSDGSTITFSFDTPVVGFAADWSGLRFPVPDNATGVLINGESFIPYDLLGADDGFFGFVDLAGISSVVLFEADAVSFSGESISLDNVRLAAPAVPLPAAAWLFLSGLVGLAGLLKRR